MIQDPRETDRPAPEPVEAETIEEEEEGAPELIDDPDGGERPPPAPTDPGQTTTDTTFPCPYCGESVDLFLEPTTESGVQEFVEECEACSREFEVRVEYDIAGTPHIQARRIE